MSGASGYVVAADRSQGERFVYSCAGCGGVLGVGKTPAPLDGILDSLVGVCPSCGAKLEGSVDCRLGRAPADWDRPASVIIPPQRADARPRAPLVQRASSYNRFSLDFARLDALLQPLAPHNLVMLQGRGASAVAELAAFRAQLPRERGGLDSNTVFVDGGNCSDPYLFASLARRYRVDAKKALRRVLNCRVFTMYQLASLLSKEVVDMVDLYGAKVLVVANILGTFDEPDTSPVEVERLLDAVRAGILKAREERQLTVIVTLGPPTRWDEMVAGWADTLVRLSPARGDSSDAVRAELLRHPTKKRPCGSEFGMNRLLFHPDSPLEAVR
ncbi:MAG: hypothetical protein ABSF83_05425 [Nitrososphaerales archaeon]|jgi:hypothetical protein